MTLRCAARPVILVPWSYRQIPELGNPSGIRATVERQVGGPDQARSFTIYYYHSRSYIDYLLPPLKKLHRYALHCPSRRRVRRTGCSRSSESIDLFRFDYVDNFPRLVTTKPPRRQTCPGVRTQTSR